MRNLILYLCCTTIGLFIFSCGKDDPAPDTEKPVITVLAPTDITKPLRATVSVKAETKDNTGIKNVEFFVDGTLLISATSSPVEASWDTKTVTDGTHQIKIVAEDTEGNKEEVTLSVEVKNTLFTFKIASNYLDSNTEGWIFITDEAGSEISTLQITNGKTITVDTPEGFSNDKTYTFNRFEYQFDDFGFASYKYVSINSYAGLFPGSFVLDNGAPTPRNSIGAHDFFATNVPLDYNFSNMVSLDAELKNYVGTLPLTTRPISTKLFQSPAKVIYTLSVGTDVPLKYEMSNAEAGGSTSVDFSEFTPFDSFIIPLADAIYSGFDVSMVRTPGDYTNTIFFNSNPQSSNADQLLVYYPNLNPHEFITSLGYNTNVDYFRYTSVNSQLPATFKKLDAEVVSVTPSSGKISVNATGDFHFLSINSYQIEEINSKLSSYDWNIFTDKDSRENIVIPTLPAILKQKYADVAGKTFKFDFVWLQKNTEVTNYKEWVKLRFSVPSVFGVSKELFRKGKYFTPFGGRSKGGVDRNYHRVDDLPGRNSYRNVN